MFAIFSSSDSNEQHNKRDYWPLEVSILIADIS